VRQVIEGYIYYLLEDCGADSSLNAFKLLTWDFRFKLPTICSSGRKVWIADLDSPNISVEEKARFGGDLKLLGFYGENMILRLTQHLKKVPAIID